MKTKQLIFLRLVKCVLVSMFNVCILVIALVLMTVKSEEMFWPCLAFFCMSMISLVRELPVRRNDADTTNGPV